MVTLKTNYFCCYFLLGQRREKVSGDGALGIFWNHIFPIIGKCPCWYRKGIYTSRTP